MTSTAPKTQFVVVTGLSGAGRSLAADHLEDLGWPVVDNLPPALVVQMVDLVQRGNSGVHRMALTLGPGQGGEAVGELTPALDILRDRVDSVQVLYLEAGTETLVHRFNVSRRRHPLTIETPQSLRSAIEAERDILVPIRDIADVVLDTSEMNVHELRRWIGSHVDCGAVTIGMQITLMSFGFKHGPPTSADLVLDCRFLLNPYWVKELRPHSGLDADVREYVLAQEATFGFLACVYDMLEFLIPAYAADGRSYLTIALGCTGGRHRSVALAEHVGAQLHTQGHPLTVEHRDVNR